MGKKRMTDGYATRPCYGELVTILLVGLVHILVEIGFSDLVAQVYNAGVSIAFLVYVAWRIRRTPGVLRIWGLRCDNFFSAAGAQLWFVAAAALALVVFAVSQSLLLPSMF